MTTILGKKVKDKITNFEGIATARIEYLYGCNQIGINPTVDKDGKLREISWFDEGRVEIIGEGFAPAEVQTEKPGCEFNDHP